MSFKTKNATITHMKRVLLFGPTCIFAWLVFFGIMHTGYRCRL